MGGGDDNNISSALHVKWSREKREGDGKSSLHRGKREITAFTARCEGDCIIIIITTILIQLFVLAHPSWRPHNASDTTQPITSPIPLHSHSRVAS